MKKLIIALLVLAAACNDAADVNEGDMMKKQKADSAKLKPINPVR